MKKTLNIVFFGNEALSTGTVSRGVILQRLLHNGYNICSIVVHETTSASRNYHEPAVLGIARDHGIPIHNPQKLSDTVDVLAEYHADVGVLAAYGKLVPEHIIKAFPAGIVNIHPSLLPAYRGPTPIEQTLLDGVTETGVSLMALVKEMDAGPIYAQNKLLIPRGTTKLHLAEQLTQLGADLLIEHLPSIVDGSLQPQAQDHSRASYTRRLTKQDAALDFRQPADEIYRRVIAFAGWPKSTMRLGNELEVIVHDVRTSDEALPSGHIKIIGDKLLVGTSTKAIEILSLQLAGRQKIPTAEFIRGYRQRIADRTIF